MTSAFTKGSYNRVLLNGNRIISHEVDSIDFGFQTISKQIVNRFSNTIIGSSIVDIVAGIPDAGKIIAKRSATVSGDFVIVVALFPTLFIAEVFSDRNQMLD